MEGEKVSLRFSPLGLVVQKGISQSQKGKPGFFSV
jgi:hypothetical protein